MSNPGNVIGGHKANLNNPNTSEESKAHSREVIEDIQATGEVDSSDSNKNPNNVAGGLKATLNNPNISEETKKSAAERLEGFNKS